MTCRSAAILSVLAAVALFLVGCGGGGGSGSNSKSHECVNKGKFDIKTQSFTGKGTLNFKGDDEPSTSPFPVSFSGSAKIDSKLDVDKLNIREDFEFSPTIKGKQVDVKTKMFFDYDKELLAFALDASGGYTYSNCGYAKLTGLKQNVSADKIKMGIQLLVGLINQGMTCSGNDGTYDTFELNEKLPDSRIPLDQTGLSGTITAKMQCDKDLMLHSTLATVDLNTPAKHVVFNGTGYDVPAFTIHVNVSLPVDGGVGKNTGPSDSDLDYSSWGKCTELKPPPHNGSIHKFFKQGRISAINEALSSSHGLGLALESVTASPAADIIFRAIDSLRKQPPVKQASVVV